MPENTVLAPRSTPSSEASQTAAASPGGAEPGESLRPGSIALIALVAFGAGTAFIVPMVFSLAIRVDAIYPGRDYLLGFATGTAALLGLFAGPVAGLFSDRHRSRFGRRRPFMVASALVGVAGLPILATADSLMMLAAGWLVASIGWSTLMATVQFIVADIVPPHQRGRVSGLVGMSMQIAHVAGLPLVGAVAGSSWGLFAIPTAVAVVCLTVFCVRVRERDTRDLPAPPPITGRDVAASFVFNPLRHRAFALTWTGRFMVFFGMGTTATFQAFFVAQRLGLAVSDVAPTLTLISGVALVPAIGGAIGLGTISDRVGRTPIITVACALYVTGVSVQAFAWALPALLAGQILASLGFAAFIAVSQATVLDVLPGRGRHTGRFLAINQFAQKLSASLAPLLAPVLMGIGGTEHANYTALFLAAAGCGVVGGVLMRRATSMPTRSAPGS